MKGESERETEDNCGLGTNKEIGGKKWEWWR